MDLKRVAMGMQRGSRAMANRFKEEALQREQELEKQEMDSYLKKLLIDSRKILLSNNPGTHEDILMYSILFQNLVQKNIQKK
jgi:hypothetical protein